MKETRGMREGRREEKNQTIGVTTCRRSCSASLWSLASVLVVMACQYVRKSKANKNKSKIRSKKKKKKKKKIEKRDEQDKKEDIFQVLAFRPPR